MVPPPPPLLLLLLLLLLPLKPSFLLFAGTVHELCVVVILLLLSLAPLPLPSRSLLLLLLLLPSSFVLALGKSPPLARHFHDSGRVTAIASVEHGGLYLAVFPGEAGAWLENSEERGEERRGEERREEEDRAEDVV